MRCFATLTINMNQNNPLNNLEIAAEQLRTHHAATGEVMTLLNLQQWFATELQRRPSTTTLAKVRKAFLDTLRTPDPKTDEMRAFERAFASAIAPYKLRAEEAERGEQDALKAADVVVANAEQAVLVAQQRCDVLLADAIKKADQADLQRLAASEASEKALAALTLQLTETHTVLSDEKARAAVAIADLEGVSSDMASLRGQLHVAKTENERLIAHHASEIETERQRSSARETRASEQMSDTTKHWAAQVSALRDELAETARKLTSAEAALLAEKAAQEKALAKARQESITAVAQEIQRLSDVLGGVNTLYNTHQGAMRSQVEALTQTVALLSNRLNEQTVARQATETPLVQVQPGVPL